MNVWRRTNGYRNVFPNYAARIKTSRGIQALKNQLNSEVYGDCLQALHILDCLNRATVTLQNRQIKLYEQKMLSYNPIVLDGAEYNVLLQTCDDIPTK